MTIPIFLIGFSVVGIIVMLLWYSSVKKRYSNNTALYEKDQTKIVNRFGVNESLPKVYQLIYNTFVNLPVLSYYTKKVRLKLEIINDYTEYEIREKTGKNMLFSLLFLFSTVLIMVNIMKDMYMSSIIIIALFMVTEKIIDMRITAISYKILKQMPEVFTNVRHAFHEHGMLEESFAYAIDELDDKDIVPQLKRIKDAMMAEKPDVELERYYDTAPNRFLKIFAGISFLTLEFGDKKIDGRSTYLNNLNNILSDIYLEILKRDKIDYRFRSLTVIAVVPILFIIPVRNWAEGTFSSLINFYSSSIGFIVQSLILVSAFVCYIILRILKEDSEVIKFDRVMPTKWQDKVYKYYIVRQLVATFRPKPHTTKEKKVINLIKNTNAYLTIEWLYINKITVAVISTVATLLLMFNIQLINISSIYNQVSEEFQSLGQLTEEQKASIEAINDKDKEYIEKFESKDYTKEQLEEAMRNETTGEVSQTEVERVYEKINSLENEYFRYWYLLISLFVGFIAYQIPTLLLIIKNKIREMEKENEIMQFQSIILMLMYIDRVDVQMILEWLSRFSYAFKDPISTCLNNYESGAIEALEILKEDVPYKDFQRIVEQLESAVERIPIKDAFDELETERAYYYEKRKASIEKIIQKKVSIGKFLGFTPAIILIGGYLVVPLLLVSIMQMTNYFQVLM